MEYPPTPEILNRILVAKRQKYEILLEYVFSMIFVCLLKYLEKITTGWISSMMFTTSLVIFFYLGVLGAYFVATLATIREQTELYRSIRRQEKGETP